MENARLVQGLDVMEGIYLIEIKHHKYVGRSKNISLRLKKHHRELKKGIHHNSRLQNAYNKYGLFQTKVLLRCSNTSLGRLIELEQFFIDNYGNCNLVSAENGHNFKFEKEVIKRMSSLKKGNKNPNYGSGRNNGAYVPNKKEWKSKISNSCKGRKNSMKGKTYDHTIYEFVKGELVEHLTRYDMRAKYGISNSQMSSLISGRYKSAKGWTLTS